MPPAIDPGGRLSEFSHPSLHHLADRLRLIQVADDACRMIHRDHSSGKRAWHSRLGRGGLALRLCCRGGCSEEGVPQEISALDGHPISLAEIAGQFLTGIVRHRQPAPPPSFSRYGHGITIYSVKIL
jgi:hypothetical protein